MLAFDLDELPLQITLQLDDQIFAAIKHSAEQTRICDQYDQSPECRGPAPGTGSMPLLTAISRYDETRDLLSYFAGPDAATAPARIRHAPVRVAGAVAGRGAEQPFRAMGEAAPVASEPAPSLVGSWRLTEEVYPDRNREVFVGRVRERTPEQEDEIVEITDPNGGFGVGFKENKEMPGTRSGRK
ncbi:hypothetical protein QNM99_20955 [Pseudomonas sp. PCH446]